MLDLRKMSPFLGFRDSSDAVNKMVSKCGQFSPSTTQIPGIELRLPGLGSKGFYLLSHLTDCPDGKLRELHSNKDFKKREREATRKSCTVNFSVKLNPEGNHIDTGCGREN